MEAVSLGAREGGAARVIGVTAPPCFPMRSGVNPFVTEEIPASSMTERIHAIVGLAAGFVVLDGSIGTLTELLVAWNVAYVDRLSQPTSRPIVAVGERWSEVVPYLTDRAATNGDLVTCVGGVEDGVGVLSDSLGAR
jgi:predicted Rossmann-fold nucleotide-binding protein